MSQTVAQAVVEHNVFLGFWNNRSYSPIKGATLTLTRSNGALLTAALAVFVTYVGARFSSIFCFGLHRWCSSRIPQDALYHQRQAMLRNSESATSITIDTFWMIWTWRSKMKLFNTLKRLMPLLLLALSLALAFGTAGVFSSRISSSMGDEVILSSSSCGYLWWDSGFDTADVDDLINYSNRLTVEAADYSRNCYRSDAVATDCPTYTRKSLPMDVVDNATCPFDPKVCLLDGDNLVIDTGRINSHSDLGINAEPRDRFDYRRVTSCAPLRTEGYSESVNKTIEGYQVPFTSYLYGKNLHNDANYTYDYSTFRTSLDAKNAADYTLMYVYFFDIVTSTSMILVAEQE